MLCGQVDRANGRLIAVRRQIRDAFEELRAVASVTVQADPNVVDTDELDRLRLVVVALAIPCEVGQV